MTSIFRSLSLHHRHYLQFSQLPLSHAAFRPAYYSIPLVPQLCGCCLFHPSETLLHLPYLPSLFWRQLSCSRQWMLRMSSFPLYKMTLHCSISRFSMLRGTVCLYIFRHVLHYCNSCRYISNVFCTYRQPKQIIILLSPSNWSSLPSELSHCAVQTISKDIYAESPMHAEVSFKFACPIDSPGGSSVFNRVKRTAYGPETYSSIRERFAQKFWYLGWYVDSLTACPCHTTEVFKHIDGYWRTRVCVVSLRSLDLPALQCTSSVCRLCYMPLYLHFGDGAVVSHKVISDRMSRAILRGKTIISAL